MLILNLNLNFLKPLCTVLVMIETKKLLTPFEFPVGPGMKEWPTLLYRPGLPTLYKPASSFHSPYRTIEPNTAAQLHPAA